MLRMEALVRVGMCLRSLRPGLLEVLDLLAKLGAVALQRGPFGIELGAALGLPLGVGHRHGMLYAS